MVAAHIYWTQEDDARLRGLVAENLSYTEIGAILGRNKNSCIGRAHRLGIKSSETKPTRPPKFKTTPVDAIFPAKAAKPIKPEAAQDNRPQPRYEQPEASTTAFGVPRSLMFLQAHHCRFPVQGEGAATLFCCGVKLPNKPYCVDHAALCYRETERQSLSRLMKAYR